MKPTALSDAEWARVMELEVKARLGVGMMSVADQAELDGLKAKAKSIAVAPEVADDPSTLADESSRPLLDGGNYNDRLKAMCCDEVKALALKYGLPLLEAAVAAIRKR